MRPPSLQSTTDRSIEPIFRSKSGDHHWVDSGYDSNHGSRSKEDQRYGSLQTASHDFRTNIGPVHRSWIVSREMMLVSISGANPPQSSIKGFFSFFFSFSDMFGLVIRMYEFKVYTKSLVPTRVNIFWPLILFLDFWITLISSKNDTCSVYKCQFRESPSIEKGIRFLNFKPHLDICFQKQIKAATLTWNYVTRSLTFEGIRLWELLLQQDLATKLSSYLIRFLRSCKTIASSLSAAAASRCCSFSYMNYFLALSFSHCSLPLFLPLLLPVINLRGGQMSTHTHVGSLCI